MGRGRGEDGADVGGVVVEGVIAPAERERGLHESLRRQLQELVRRCRRRSVYSGDSRFTAVKDRIAGSEDLLFARRAKLEETGSHLRLSTFVFVFLFLFCDGPN